VHFLNQAVAAIMPARLCHRQGFIAYHPIGSTIQSIAYLSYLSASELKAVNFLASIKKRSKPLWVVAAGCALIGVVGSLDFLTGYELGFSLFYLVPISLVTWFRGLRLGIMICLASASVWLIAEMSAGISYSHPAIYAWNTIIRLGFFITVTFLLSTTRRALDREKELARTDYLTGAANSRFFSDFVEMEIDRSERYGHPFTIAYIDLDNFKAVNDQLGHATGDQVLYTVANHIKKNLRKSDVVARLGGDEFALLLPETGLESAQGALAKLQHGLVEEMQRSNWPITFSVGVLTCIDTPSTTYEIVRLADDLMYSVKREGKNAIKYSTYTAKKQKKKLRRN